MQVLMDYKNWLPWIYIYWNISFVSISIEATYLSAESKPPNTIKDLLAIIDAALFLGVIRLSMGLKHLFLMSNL